MAAAYGVTMQELQFRCFVQPEQKKSLTAEFSQTDLMLFEEGIKNNPKIFAECTKPLHQEGSFLPLSHFKYS